MVCGSVGLGLFNSGNVELYLVMLCCIEVRLILSGCLISLVAFSCPVMSNYVGLCWTGSICWVMFRYVGVSRIMLGCH